jgi:hypothetical protein
MFVWAGCTLQLQGVGDFMHVAGCSAHNEGAELAAHLVHCDGRDDSLHLGARQHDHRLEGVWVDLRRPPISINHAQQCAIATPNDEIAAGALTACGHPQRDQVLARTLVLEDVVQTDLHQ